MRVQATVLALLLLLAVAVPVVAQRTTASIRGTVTDATGGVVPGANVTVKGTDTGFKPVHRHQRRRRVLVSRAAGRHLHGRGRAQRLQVRRSDGHRAQRRRRAHGQRVSSRPARSPRPSPSSHRRWRSRRSAAKWRASSPASRCASCPLNGRNFLQLGTLMPGVSQGDGFNTKDRGLMSGIELAVSGSGLGGNMWTVDGANNNDVGSNRTILVFPSVDAIDEFKVHRNSYGAEFGGAAGAQINIVTRGGTNEFHGSGYYFGRNDALAATRLFPRAGRPAQGPAERPRLRRDLRRTDRQGQAAVLRRRRSGTGRSAASRAPRSCRRRPSAPATSAARDRRTAPPPTPIDPLTGAAFPGNRFPPTA